MLCGSLDGRGIGGRLDIRIHMFEFSHCSPEHITALIGYVVNSVAKLCPTPCGPVDYSRQAPHPALSPRSLLKFMSVKLVMPSNHLSSI